MSLIPEKPISFSPTLAATIGLEETVLLQLLQECRMHGEVVQSSGFCWATISGARLLSLTPFWQEQDIKRLVTSLHEKGLLLIGGGPFSAQDNFRFAFNEGVGSEASVKVDPSHTDHSYSGTTVKAVSAKTIAGN